MNSLAKIKKQGSLHLYTKMLHELSLASAITNLVKFLNNTSKSLYVLTKNQIKEDLPSLLIIALIYHFISVNLGLIMLILYWPEKQLLRFSIVDFEDSHHLESRYWSHTHEFFGTALPLLLTHYTIFYAAVILHILTTILAKVEFTHKISLIFIASGAIAIFLPASLLGVNSKLILAAMTGLCHLFGTYAPSEDMLKKREEHIKGYFTNVFMIIRHLKEIKMQSPEVLNAILNQVHVKVYGTEKEYKKVDRAAVMRYHPDKARDLPTETQRLYDEAIRATNIIRAITPRETNILLDEMASAGITLNNVSSSSF